MNESKKLPSLFQWLDVLEQAVIVIDRAGYIIFWNRQAERLYGWLAGEASGRSLADTILSKIGQEQLVQAVAGLQLGQHWSGESLVQRRNGRSFSVSVTASPLADPEGRLLGFITIHKDLMVSREAEEIPDTDEERFAAFLDHLPAVVFLKDQESRTLYVNQAFKKLFGERDWTGWITPDQAMLSADKQALAEGLSAREETVWDTDGVERLFQTLKFRVPRPGKAALLGGFALEITELKQAEKALRESEEKFKKLTENSYDIITVLDAAGIINFESAATKRVLGYEAGSRVGKNILDFVHLDDHLQLIRAYHKLLLQPGGMTRVEFRFRHQDGSWRVLEAIGQNLVDDPLTRGIVINSRDITERKRTEEALRSSEQRLLDIINFLPDATFVINHQAEIIAWNRAIEEMTGYKAEDMLNKGSYEYSLPFYGTRRPILIDAALKWDEAIEEQYAWIEKRSQMLIAEVYLAHLKPGGAYIWAKATPLYDSKGNLVGAIESIRDVTERKRSEEALRQSHNRLEETLAKLKATQQQAFQQERLAAVGQLAAGIAHDFNNLLTSIIGFAELLRQDPLTSDTARVDLGRIVQQGQRGAHLVRQILDFSRKSIPQRQLFDLVSFLTEAVQFLRRTIPENITISQEVELRRLPIEADPVQLQQVLTNLALNARDAMPAGGELRLHLSLLSLAPGEPPPYSELPPGRWAVITVSDSGSGISSEALPHIFEPFFTTKKTGEGTGLGLAQVYGIVKQHEGYVDVDSRVGQGTVVKIYLPGKTHTAIQARLARISEDEMISGYGQTVLLVEDETDVLTIGQAMLERLGYRVLPAISGEQGLQLYIERQAEINLVLMDMVMPGMDGLTLFQALKRHNPAVKAVLMTGYPLGEETHALLAQGITDWLQKPLTLARLAQVLAASLRSQPPY